MAASDYISLVQHQQVRAQRLRPTKSRHTMERPIKRVRAPRGSGLSGGKYNAGYRHKDIHPPRPDRFGEQYNYGYQYASGSGYF